MQDRLRSSNVHLRDGGAKIEQRISSLTSQIAAFKASLPVAADGMRGAAFLPASCMVPISKSGNLVKAPALRPHVNDLKSSLQAVTFNLLST